MEKYYLRLVPVNGQEQEIWEETDIFIYENMKNCLNGNLQRYSGDYVYRSEKGDCKIHVINQEITTLLTALRLAGVSGLIMNTVLTAKGIVKRPEMVKFKRGKKNIFVHENFSTLTPLKVV